MTAPTTTGLTDRGRAAVAVEMAVVRNELSRVDAKAATLVGLSGAGLVYCATATAAPATALLHQVLLVGAGVALAVAAVLALLALRPRFGPMGLCRWARMDLDLLAALMNNADGDSARDLKFMSGLVLAKFTALRRAVNALLFAVVLLIGAVTAGLLT